MFFFLLQILLCVSRLWEVKVRIAGEAVVQMIFVTILLNLFNSKHLLKIAQIILPEKICTSQLQLRTKRNPIQKKKNQDTKVDAMLKSRLEGNFLKVIKSI